MAYPGPWQWNPVLGTYEIVREGESERSGDISAIDLFRNSTLFLLGATGFVGKVLLATILDRFPELKRLVILVRRKKALSGERRFYTEILTSPPLRPTVERLGEEHIRQRVTIVEGDLSLPLCGMSPTQLEALRGQVDVVVNTAGLVEFDPPLTDSLITNVYGILNLIELVQQLGTKMVHISTCYVAGKRNGRIPEDTPIVGYYPGREGEEDRRFDVWEELAWCESFIRETVRAQAGSPSPPTFSGDGNPTEEIRQKVPNTRSVREELRKGGMERAEHWGWINTYTYTKSMGEQLIASSPGLDFSIVRPAIVESAMRFPFPGWNEGLTTSAPLVLMGGEGVKNWPVRRDGPLEIIPVDLIATGILVATAAMLCGRHRTVYQLATASDNPVMLPRLVAFLGMNARYKHKHRRTGNRLVRLWKAYIETRVVSVEELEARRERLRRGLEFYHAVLNLLKALLGGRVVDPFLRGLRAARRQIRQQEQTVDKFLPFMIHNSFIFETGNIREAFNNLTDTDRERLLWDPERIDWADYWVNVHTKGIETWIRPVFVKQQGKSPDGASFKL